MSAGVVRESGKPRTGVETGSPEDTLASRDEEAVEARGLKKSYAGRLVVDVDSLAVHRKETFVLLGPNGSGKSTLLRMLALVEQADAGQVRHFGIAAGPNDLQARRRIAVVLQRPLAFQGKVSRNVALGLRMRRVARAETRVRVGEALELLGISHLAEVDARRLSGGELQRVSLARALVLRPEILFLDEPTGALDAGLRARFRHDLMAAVGEVGSTVMLVTHDQAEAIGLADRLAVMQDGRVVQQGRTEEVLSRPRNRLVAVLMGAETIWRGHVEESRQGLCVVRTRAGMPVEVVSHCRPGEEVTVVIRAEDVALSLEEDHPAESSVRNHWRGSVHDLLVDGSVVRVRVRLAGAEGWVREQELAMGLAGDRLGTVDRDSGHEVGTEDYLTALITRPSAAELGLTKGKRVVVGVKATATHILEN